MTGGANVIDSLFIALGFKVDPSGAKDVKSQVDRARSSIMSLGTALKGIATGFVLKEIADIGSTFEQNMNVIAGSLSALGFASDFNAGLKEAEKTLKSITHDAAILPGEASDYIEVFQAGLPFLKAGIPGGSVQDITNFTNKLTAVAKSVAKGMDTGQIARESTMLLAAEGRAGGHNVLFQKLLPFLMQVEGQANLTAQSFNAMTQPQRVQLLQAAFVKLQPLIDAQADSFDAMWGAAVSGAKQLTRVATAGLFKGMKKGLQELTSLVIDNNGELTELGETITDTIATGARWGMQLVQAAVGIFRALSKLPGAVVAVGVAIGLMLGPTKLLIAALAIVVEDIYQFFTGGKSVIGLLMEKFPIAFTMLTGGLVAIGVAMAAMRAKAVVDLAVLGVKAVSTAASMGAAWAAALGPLLLIVAALGAGAAAGQALSNAINALEEPQSLQSFNAVPYSRHSTEDETAFLTPGHKRDNAGVSRKGPIVPEASRYGWTPGAAPPPGAGPVSQADSHDLHVNGPVTVVANNPKEMRRELSRGATRNAQSKVGL
jgi:hypothetical protein